MNRTDQLVLQFRDVLKETERFSADDLKAYQDKLLEPLLRHARAHAPFYEHRLDAVFDGERLDLSRWREIPLLTREQANRDRLALKAKTVPPHLGSVKEDETSGSLGRPMRFYINELVDVAALAMTDRLYRWWHFDGSKPIAFFVSPRMKITNPERTTTHGWRSGFLEGLNHLRQSTGDMDAHIDWLADIRPTYLCSYASMLRPLAERTLVRGTRLRLDRIISRGGVVDQELWALCRQAFDARLVDQYGANEIGQIACQCPNCDAYHVNAEAMLVEILDEDGAPVAPGETGRVVLTSFYNYAMPFIRYEIGDRAMVSADSGECDITLPRLSRIAGRYRNNFVLRNGQIIFPNPPMSRFRTFFSYSQLQVVQTDYEEIEVRYVPADEKSKIDEAGLERWLQEELDPGFSVKLVAVDPIPPAPSGKFEDFISLVGSKPVRDRANGPI